MGNDQDAKETVLKWQNQRQRWAHYVTVNIPGHRNLRTSCYVEQNHSSLAQRVPDNAKKSVVQFIVDIIGRSGDVLDERQGEWMKWDASSASAIQKMDRMDRPHLREAREQLHQKPYLRFWEQYKLRTSYNVSDAPNGVNISHTGSPDKVRFLEDGKRCTCEHVFAWEDECRHEIAKRMHRKQTAFCAELFSQLHLFNPVMEKLKAADASVPHLESATGDDGNPFGDTADFGSPDVDFESSLEVEDTRQSKRQRRGGKTGEPSFSQISMSPSKMRSMGAGNISLKTQRDSCNINANVGYGKLQTACTELASVTSSHDNSVQHVIYTTMDRLKSMLEKGDFSAERHKGTTIEAIANQLCCITGKESQASAHGGMAVKSHVPRQGANPKNRLGGARSTVGKKTPSCGFCNTAGDHPGNQLSCPRKKNWGNFVSLKKDKGTACTKLQDVVEGRTMEFSDLTEEESLSGKAELTQPPRRAKRVQVKGYKVGRDGKKYVFCTCIDRYGNALTQLEGHHTVSYEDIFIDYLSLVASMRTYDFVFFSAVSQDALAALDLQPDRKRQKTSDAADSEQLV